MGSPMTGIPGTHPMAGVMMPTAGLNLGTLGGLAMGTLGSQMYNIRATPQQLQYIQQQLATQQATNTAKDVANQQKQIADTVSKALVDAGIVKKEEEPDKPDKPPPRTSPRKKNVAFAEEEPETHEEEEEEPEQPISKSKRQREKRLAARDTLMTRVETLAEENKKLKAYKTFIEDGNPTTRDGYASDGEVDGKTRSKSIMQLIEGANSLQIWTVLPRRAWNTWNYSKGEREIKLLQLLASEARRKLVTLTMAFLKWTQHRTKVQLD